jgi:diketogulonate reductase-like aldo/keto reductase
MEFRKEIFITSKLNPKYNGAKAYEHVRKSVEALRTEYIDLFLIHWPGKSGLRVQDKRNQEARRLAWEGLEKAYGKLAFIKVSIKSICVCLDEGLVRSIGISNYQPQHMDELMEHARIQPAVNQCEFHPAFCPQDVLDSCKKHGIVFQVCLLNEFDNVWSLLSFRN